jgi:SAM-dependent methyltransferase
MVRRILRVTGVNRNASVLSLGCGIGDTELLLAPYVERVTGIDLSPAAITQAREDAYRTGVRNVEFLETTLEAGMLEGRSFDAIVAIFFLHHLPDAELDQTAAQIPGLLKPHGVFYSLDPSQRRLSGKLGKLLVPNLMRRYQTPDERELDPQSTAEIFRRAGLNATHRIFDFASSPLAGLFPSWRLGYRASRWLDDGIIHVPGIKNLGSNFEIIAKKLQ